MLEIVYGNTAFNHIIWLITATVIYFNQRIVTGLISQTIAFKNFSYTLKTDFFNKAVMQSTIQYIINITESKLQHLYIKANSRTALVKSSTIFAKNSIIFIKNRATLKKGNTTLKKRHSLLF